MSKRRKTYWEKLQDARWQLKKVHLFNLMGGYCHYPGCEHQHLQLDVHHRVYLRNKDPWDYPDWCFDIFCKFHHEVEQDRMERAHLAIASNPQLIKYCIDNALENPSIILSSKAPAPPAKKQIVSQEDGKSLFAAMRESLKNNL